MAPSRIDLRLLRLLIRFGTWQDGLAVVATRDGGKYTVCRK